MPLTDWAVAPDGFWIFSLSWSEWKSWDVKQQTSITLNRVVASGWAAYTHIWPKVKYFNLFYLQIYNDKIKAWRIKTLDHFFVFFFIVTSLVGSLMNDQLFLHLVSSTQQSYLELSQRVDCQLDWVWYIDKQAWAECVGFFFAFVLLCFFCFFSSRSTTQLPILIPHSFPQAVAKVTNYLWCW